MIFDRRFQNKLKHQDLLYWVVLFVNYYDNALGRNYLVIDKSLPWQPVNQDSLLTNQQKYAHQSAKVRCMTRVSQLKIGKASLLS